MGRDLRSASKRKTEMLFEEKIKIASTGVTGHVDTFSH